MNTFFLVVGGFVYITIGVTVSAIYNAIFDDFDSVGTVLGAAFWPVIYPALLTMKALFKCYGKFYSYVNESMIGVVQRRRFKKAEAKRPKPLTDFVTRKFKEFTTFNRQK